jgi:hypothetical protein
LGPVWAQKSNKNELNCGHKLPGLRPGQTETDFDPFPAKAGPKPAPEARPGDRKHD